MSGFRLGLMLGSDAGILACSCVRTKRDEKGEQMGGQAVEGVGRRTRRT